MAMTLSSPGVYMTVVGDKRAHIGLILTNGQPILAAWWSVSAVLMVGPGTTCSGSYRLWMNVVVRGSLWLG